MRTLWRGYGIQGLLVFIVSVLFSYMYFDFGLIGNLILGGFGVVGFNFGLLFGDWLNRKRSL
jgi:hypothetical protein